MPPNSASLPEGLSMGSQQPQRPHSPQPEPGGQENGMLVDTGYGAQRGLAAKKAEVHIKNDELRHVSHNRPRHLVRLHQKRTAKDRARAYKAKKERENRQNRIDRDLPVPPSPTQSELDTREAASQALSAKLKGRTKRSVLERIIGSGGLHAWKEKTITDHAAHIVPTAYEWSWRQKEFRCEERITDRIDRMVGRMIGKHDAEHQEQLRLDREAYMNQQVRHMERFDHGTSNHVAGSGTFAKKALSKGTNLISFNNKAHATDSPSKPTNLKGESRNKIDQSMNKGFVETHEKMETSKSQHIYNSHTLASDVAAFVDENDDLDSLLGSLSGLHDESVNTNELFKYIKKQNHDHCVDEGNLQARFSFSNSGRENDTVGNTVIQDYCDKFDVESSNLEYTEEKESAFKDIMAVEWLNNFLEKSANEVFLTAARRFCPDGYISPEDLTALRDHVVHDIKQEWALSLRLEEITASKNNKPLDLDPFKKAFGPSFEKDFMSAVSDDQSHVFVKMARVAANMKNEEVTDNAMDVDNEDTDDDESEQEDELYSRDMWDPHEYVTSSPLSQDDEPVNSVNGDNTPGATIEEQRQEVLHEALISVAENILDSNHRSVAVDERRLRRLWGPDWRLQYTAAFNSAVRETLTQQDPYKDTENSRDIRISEPQPSREYQPRYHLRWQTDPCLWPRIEPGRDQIYIDAVNKDLAKDTYNIKQDADANERNSNWASARTRDSGFVPLNELMDFDRPPYFDLKKRTRDAPDEYRHEPKRHKPLKIDPQDSYVMGCFWPLADDGEAWSYSREEVDLERREDAYDGTAIPVPKLPPPAPRDKKNKGMGIPQNKHQNKRSFTHDLTHGEAMRKGKLYSEQAKIKRDSIKKEMEENERNAKLLSEEHEKKIMAGWRPNSDNVLEIHDPVPGIHDPLRFGGSNLGLLNRTDGISNDSTTMSQRFGLTPIPPGKSDVTLGSSFGQKINDTETPSTADSGQKANDLDAAGNLVKVSKVISLDKTSSLNAIPQDTKMAAGTVPYPTFSSMPSSSKSPGPLGVLDHGKLTKPNLSRTAFDHSSMSAGQKTPLGTKPGPEIFEKNPTQSNHTATPNIIPNMHVSLVPNNPSSPRKGFTPILGPTAPSPMTQDSSGINGASIIDPTSNNPEEQHQGETVSGPSTMANVLTGDSPNNTILDPVTDTSGITALAQVRRELKVLKAELQRHGNEKLRTAGPMTPKDMNMLVTKIGGLQDACLKVATDNSAKVRRAQINLLRDIKSLEEWVGKLCEAVQEQAQVDVQLCGLF